MKVKIAKSFKDKLLGLMYQKNIDYGLLITNSYVFYIRKY